MSGGILVASLGISSFILLILFLKLGEEQEKAEGWTRYPLQIILFGFLLGILLLLGKASYDYKDNCSWLVNTSITSGNQSNYTYAYTCSTNTQNTASAFYDITVWVLRIVIAYIFFAFAFSFIGHLKDLKEGKGKGDGGN